MAGRAPGARAVELTIESDRERMGKFPHFVPGPIGSIDCSGVTSHLSRSYGAPGPQAVLPLMHRRFYRDKLRIVFQTCHVKGLPPASCGMTA